MSTQKVLIIGATGNVGRSLVRQLLELPNPPSVRGSTRNLARASFPASVEGVEGDLEDRSSYSRLFQGVHTVFTYAGEETPWSDILPAAKSAEVKRIVLLSSMTVEFDPQSQIGAIHRRAEDAIKDCGLEYSFIRPRNFSSNSKGHWGPTIKKTGKLWITYPNSHTAPVSEDDMAAVALVCIVTDKQVGQAIPLCGPVSFSQRDQVDTINRVRQKEGKEPIELIVLEPQDWKSKMQQWRGESFDPVFADQLLKWWDENDEKPEKIQSSERITGKPSQPYDEWVEMNKEAFL